MRSPAADDHIVKLLIDACTRLLRRWPDNEFLRSVRTLMRNWPESDPTEKQWYWINVYMRRSAELYSEEQKRAKVCV